MEKFEVDVSIIIVNYNTYELTCNCISSIISQTIGLSYEIIVVDNKSTKENADLIKQKFNQILLIKSDKNIGFSGGNNLGIAKAKGRYVLLLNSDTIILDNAIFKCFNYLNNCSSEIGLLSCKLLNEDGSFQPSTSGKEVEKYSFLKQVFLFELYENNPFLYHFNKLIDKIKYSKKNSSSYSYENDVYNTMYVSGAFMLFKKNNLDKFGSLDNDFFMYYEEIEWLYRIWTKNYKILYYPKAKVTHLAGASSSSGSDRMISQKILSKCLMYYKNHGYKGYVVINVVNIINLFSNLLALPVMGSNGRRTSKWFIKNYIYSMLQIIKIPFVYNRKVSLGSNPLVANNLMKS